MFLSKGFLSATLSALIPNILRDFAPWFSVVESFNNLGMRVLPAVKADQTSNQQLVAAVLYGRTLASFQAAIVLTERGMLADARTVVRAAAETAILLCAVVRDAKVCNHMIDRHLWHHRKLCNSWLNDPQAIAEMTPQQVDDIKAKIADIDKNYPETKKIKGDPISLDTLARTAGVNALYNVVYRLTSGDAAHTSIDALNRHVRADEQQKILGLKFGPEVGDLPHTLSDAMSVLGHALLAVLELFALSQFSANLDQCIASWKALGVPEEFTP